MTIAGNNDSEQLPIRRDSKESLGNSDPNEGIDPPGFFIEEKGIHKNTKHEDDESTLSGLQSKQKNNNKSMPETIGEDALPETANLLQSVHEVEERLKAREQYKLVIHKIGLSKLINAHRLLKNQPWLRAAYGQTVTWTMPSPQRLQEDKKPHTTNAFDHVRCSCNSDGSAADWSGMDWSFSIERNTFDRQDFVLAVCSRDVVVGRYVLSKDDLSELLTQQLDLQKSGKSHGTLSGQLFMVEGEILNDLGNAGHITFLCRVVPVVEKTTPTHGVVKPVNVIDSNHESKGVEKDVTVENSNGATKIDEKEQNASTSKIVNGIASVSMENKPTMEVMTTTDQVANNKLSDIPVIEDDFDIDQQMIGIQDALAAEAMTRSFVSLRILGVALMDLKSVHLFEPNSPVLSIESDTWHTQTEAKRQSGHVAKWAGLFWKVNVRRDVGLLVTVTSLDKLVGRALLTTEELLSSPAIQFSQQEPANSGSISVTNTNLQIHQLVKTLSNGSDYTGRVKINMIVNHPDDLVDALQIFANDHLTQIFSGNNILQNKAIFHPFQIMVREAVALEVAVPAWLRLLRPGSMKIPITLHCAAGSWAQSTNVVHSDGKLAHWLALGWCVPLLSEASAMRLTLWCGDVSVGAASLSPDELKTLLLHHTNSSMYSGNNAGEVLVQLRDIRGHVAAKLKLHCRYDVLSVANDGTVIHNSRPQSGVQRPMATSVNNNNLNIEPNRRPISALNTIKESSPTATSFFRPLSAGLYLPGEHNEFHNLQQQQSIAGSNPFLAPSQFPILVTLVELSLIDLLVPSSMLGSLPMFLAYPSGPVLQLLCDRQSLNTASLPEDDNDHYQINYSSGGQQQQSTRWMHLPPKQWTLRIRHDSSFSLAVSMRRGKHVQPIGKAQLQPLDQLLGLPVDCDNFAKLTVTIRSPEGDVAGRVVMKMLIRPIVSENNKDTNDNAQDSLFAVSVAQDNSPYNAANIEKSKARMRIEEMQRQARDDVGRLRQEAQLISTMPWNQRSVNSELDNNNNVVFGGFSVVGNSNNKDNNKTLFDPRVIMDAAHSLHPHHKIQFRVCIDEIDLWELRKMHRLKRNDCRVAAASGKWTASTIVASQMRSKQAKHPNLQSGLDQDSLDDADSDMAADRCYWTRLDWKFSVFEKQQRLRLTVSSRGKVLGGTVVLVEDLMELTADYKGGRRLTSELLGPDDEFAGNIQLTFHLDVLQSAQTSSLSATTRNKNIPSSANSNNNNNNNNNNILPPMFSPSANNSYVNTDDDANTGWGYTPHHVMEERRFSASSRGAQYVFGAEPSVLSRGHSLLSNPFNRNHTMDPVDADEQDRNMRQLPRFPCILLLRDLAALDLLPLQQPKSLLQLSKQKKQKHLGYICIEVYAENFFQTTELNWSVAVQEASVVRLVVRDDFKNEIGHCDLSPKQLFAVPPNSKGMREVMLALERDGLCAGKLMARALFQPLPPLLINNPQNINSSVLYNMQVNYKHNQQAGAGVIIDEHRYNDSITSSQILPVNINANSNNNSDNHQRGRSNSMQSQQFLLQPGNLLEHSVTSETHQTSNGAYPFMNNNNMNSNNIVSQKRSSPDITYVVDTPQNNNINNANTVNNARPRLLSHGEESVLTYDTVSPLQSRRSSIQPPPNSNITNNMSNLAMNTYVNQYTANNNNNYDNANFPSQQQPTRTLRPSFNNNVISNVATTKQILAQRAPLPLLTTSDSQNNSSSYFPSLFQRSSKDNNNNGFNIISSLPSLSVGDALSSVCVVIRAIALIDLPRAHTFAANQPVISLACGRFTATLPVNINNFNNNSNNSNSSSVGGAMSVTDGQTAAWNHLHISFSFDQGAQLRVHVTSRGSTIGICALNRQRMLSGRRSAQSGAFVIVDELLPPTANSAAYKAVGKLKLVYDLPDQASPSHT